MVGKSNFLFMDEAISDPIDGSGTRISALTGILVPFACYSELRHKFYDQHRGRMPQDPNALNLSPPELHGSKMLPDALDDEKRFEVFEGITTLVLEHQISVYRVAYYVTDKTKETFRGDRNLVGLCWLGILWALQAVLESEVVVPVMDSCNDDVVPKYSVPIRSMDIMRSAGLGRALSVANSENVLGEVFYADSRFSVFTQVVDVVSYLRLVGDLQRENRPLTKFKQRLLRFCHMLEKVMANDDKAIAINLDESH